MKPATILSEIWIYPIKSLGGIQLQKANVEERGLQHDRRWLVIDQNNQFVNQRDYPEMTLIDVKLAANGLLLKHQTRPSLGELLVPFHPETLDILMVTVWDDTIEAVVVSPACNQWFSEALGMDARLVFMPNTSSRLADPAYAPFDVNVSFADGFPYLLIGQSSLDLLNSHLESPIEMLRFRPNFVVKGSLPHEEDNWKLFKINDIEFMVVKPCARCVMITIDPKTASKGIEPLKTLATYRKRNNKIYFGQNVLSKNTGQVCVGDVVLV